MLKRYTFWTKMAAGFLLLTGAAHSLSLFVTPNPENETERQLVELMTTYKMDGGGFGYHPTFHNLFTAVSSCFALLYIFGALILFYLLFKRAGSAMIGGLLNIFLLIYGVCFVIMTIFAFPAPIIMTGLVFIALVAARLTAAFGKKDLS